MTVKTPTARLRSRVQAFRDLPEPAQRRAIRITAGVGVAELAEVVGVSRNAILLWEKGERTPQGDNRLRYVEALRIMRGAAA